MKALRRNKRKLAICHMYQDGAIKKFKEPIILYENYQVTNSEADLVSMGMESYIYIRIKTSLSHLDYYHLGDRVYINNPVPEEHDILCKGADYEVYHVPVPTLNECEIMLKKLSGRNGI